MNNNNNYGQDFDLTLQFVNDACRYDTYCSAAGCGCGVVNMRDFEMPWPSWQPPPSGPVFAVPPGPFPNIVAYGPPPGSVVLPPTFAQPCFDWPNEAGYVGEQPPGCLF